MIEVKGNILSPDIINEADAICFTSNGIIKNNGCLTMGAGVAKAFRDNFRGVDKWAGLKVKDNGNVCQIIMRLTKTGRIGLDDVKGYTQIVAFPTKHHWRNPSSLTLIKKSAKELMSLVEENNWTKVYLPFPGIGKGGLSKKEVRDAIRNILDDRIILCYL